MSNPYNMTEQNFEISKTELIALNQEASGDPSEWDFSSEKCDLWLNAVDMGFAKGNMELAKWIIKECPNIFGDEYGYCCYIAASNGQVMILKELYTNSSLFSFGNALYGALGYGQVDVLEWIRSTGYISFIPPKDSLFEIAFKGKQRSSLE